MELLGTGAPTPKVRALVADNAEIIARTLATILDLAGYEVVAVFDGEAAVKLLDRFEPDLLITDVTMPGRSGIEVASIAQLVLPRCRILLFTGYTELQHLLGTHDEVLPFDLVMKPIHPKDLLAKLKNGLCSDQPSLLVPITIDEENVH